MTRYLYPIPDNLNPTGTICVPVSLPADYQYISIFRRHMGRLLEDRFWSRDDNDSAIIVRDIYEEVTYIPFIDSLINNDTCGQVSNGSCYRLDTTSEVFQWYPNDPFKDPGNLDDGKQIASLLRWGRWDSIDSDRHPVFQSLTDNVSGFLGYFANDAILSIDPAGLFANPITKLGNLIDIFTSFPFPYVMFEFSGTGQVEIEILNVPLGGTAILIPNLDLSLSALWDTLVSFIDDGVAMPQLWQFAETNRDVIAIPPETIASFTVEFEFTEDTDHTIHVVFMPRIDDSLPAIFPFGGIREIEICGDIVMKGGQTGNNYTRQNHKLSTEVKDGFIMATQDDLYNALVRWTNERANRWLFGSNPDNILSGVSIDKDTGEIVLNENTDTIAPEFETTFQEQRNGAYYNMAEQFKNAIDDLNDNITNLWQQSTIQRLLTFNFNITQLTAFALAEYISANPQIAINVADLTEDIYCSGDFRTGLFSYATANHTESEIKYILDLADDIPNATLQQWYADGKNSPLNLYTGYACYRQPFQTITITPANYSLFKQWFTSALPSRQWRLEIQVIEPMLDADGDLYDGVYYVPNGGNPTNFYETRLILANNSNIPPLAKPSYLGGTGKYVMIYNVASTLAGTTFQGANPFTTPVSGELKLSIYDLGSL